MGDLTIKRIEEMQAAFDDAANDGYGLSGDAMRLACSAAPALASLVLELEKALGELHECWAWDTDSWEDGIVAKTTAELEEMHRAPARARALLSRLRGEGEVR